MIKNKMNLFNYMKYYYNITNSHFPLYVSGKYYVGKQERLITIIIGHIILYLSWIPFLFDDKLLYQITICFSLIIIGFVFLIATKFNIVHVLVLYHLYKTRNIGFNGEIYEYFLYKKESRKNTIFNLLINKYKKAIIIKKILSINIYIKNNNRYIIKVRKNKIIIYKKNKKYKIINYNKQNTKDIYYLILSYID